MDYLSTIVAMGLNPQPGIKDYFSKNDIFGSAFVKKIIKSYNKFYEINNQIHFDINFIINKINLLFKKFYDPEDVLVIDETLILFKGICKFRQHVPNKPYNTGLKYFSLCDSSKYLYHFWLYQGKKIDQPPNSVKNIIKTFIHNIPDIEGRRILADNYYGSLDIAKYLNKKKIQFIFTCRTNRPSFLWKDLQENLKKGAWVYSSKDNIIVCSFFDSQKVNFLSNCIGVEPFIGKKNKIKPEICMVYNKQMGAVDRFNSHLNRYLYSHRKSKWTKCSLFSIFQMVLVNSWIIFKKINLSKIKFKDFLVKFLLTYSQLNPEIPLEVPNQNFHLIKKDKKIKKCSFCKKIKKFSNTVYFCSNCLVPLHDDCFEKYHSSET